jgi:hypothetical protein
MVQPIRVSETNMPGRSLAPLGALTAHAADAGFDLSRMRIFTSVPEGSYIGIATLRGMVVIYDERPLHEEGVVAGAYYVRERQQPRSCRTWVSWLSDEWENRGSQAGPASPLTIRREAVKAIRWPNEEDWSVRLPGGHVDGPYHDWAFGRDFVGKIVGVYLPTRSAKEC